MPQFLDVANLLEWWSFMITLQVYGKKTAPTARKSFKYAVLTLFLWISWLCNCAKNIRSPKWSLSYSYYHWEIYSIIESCFQLCIIELIKMHLGNLEHTRSVSCFTLSHALQNFLYILCVLNYYQNLMAMLKHDYYFI